LATLASSIFSSGLSLLLPVALIAWAVALLTGLVQNVFLLRPANLIPSWSRVSPRRAFARMTAARLIARALLVLLELGVVAWVYSASGSEAIAAAGELVSSGDPGPIDPSAVARTVAESALGVAVSAASGLLFLAAGDWALERYFLLRDLRMTREEVIAEARENEPDAGLAAERRRRWRDRHGRRDEGEGER
ncbi:MAG TPA: EscU/YscU/HrcU family type III secretion system export apparatus switch protein, partial [Planctomycetota bacterium]|nr:EscU/YscU/HrcU family type III secretion system export apparatus switch protein [Planctomycetota bacterium]